MSRIGRAPVVIPAGVTVTQDGNTLTVKGPKGELTREFHPNMTIEITDSEVLVTRPNDIKMNKSLHGLTLCADRQYGYRRYPGLRKSA